MDTPELALHSLSYNLARELTPSVGKISDDALHHLTAPQAEPPVQPRPQELWTACWKTFSHSLPGPWTKVSLNWTLLIRPSNLTCWALM